jgi:hypothetical protein
LAGIKESDPLLSDKYAEGANVAATDVISTKALRTAEVAADTEGKMLAALVTVEVGLNAVIGFWIVLNEGGKGSVGALESGRSMTDGGGADGIGELGCCGATYGNRSGGTSWKE